MEIGSELRRLRLARDWTQEEAAEKVGIKQSYYGQIETGARKALSHELRLKLAIAFNVPTTHFDTPEERAAASKMASLLAPIRGESGYPIAVRGVVGAGSAIDTPDERETVWVPARCHPADAAYRVAGNSMTGMGVANGDLIIVRRKPEPEEGEMVVAWLTADAGTVLKLLRYNSEDGSPELYSVDSDGEKRIDFDPAAGDMLIGVFAGFFRPPQPPKKKRK